jgi:cell division protein FtsB
MLAWIEIGFATMFFFSSIFYVRPAKRVAKALQKAEKLNEQAEKLNQQAEKLKQKTENLN